MLRALWRRTVRATLTSIAVFACLAVGPSDAASADTQPAPADDATLHIKELTIPPSEFWSPEFTAFYADILAKKRGHKDASSADPHPAKDSPRADWDKYYAYNDAILADDLTRAKVRYPVEVLDTTMAGVHVGVITPKGGTSEESAHRILINVHGGGFVDFKGLSLGQLESILVASLGRIKIITVDYRQSPYFQYPAASEDVEKIYREILKKYKPEAIGIFGCSAGGNLTAQLVSWFQAKGLPRPGAIGIFGFGLPYPRQKRGDSQFWGVGVPRELPAPANTPLFSSAANEWYMANVKADDAVAFPGLSNSVLARFPPTLFLAGTREVAMSLAITSHARLLKLGVDSSLYLMEGGTHCAQAFASGTPEAHDASVYIAKWFGEHLGK